MWAVVTIALVVLAVSLDLIGYMIRHVDMLLGMGLGMSTGPLLSVAVKRWRKNRKVKKMLRDIVEMRKAQTGGEETEEQEHSGIL